MRKIGVTISIAVLLVGIILVFGQTISYGMPDAERGSTVRIMPLGDSITRGGGSSGEVGYRRPLYHHLVNLGYDVELTGSLLNGTPLDFDREHEGHGSYRADQIEDTVYTWLTSHPADIILLHIGTNDIAGGNQDVAEVEGILDEIDRWETDHDVEIIVIVARIILRYDGIDQLTRTFNLEVEAMVNDRIATGDNLVLVDMESALEYPTDLRDGVHPNDIGYVKMAGVWFDELEQILPTPTIPSDNPAVSNVDLTATSPMNASSDDLECSYTLEGDATTAAVAWYTDDVPMMEFYLPIEGGMDNCIADYSGNGQTITATSLPSFAWRPGEGHDGQGALAFDPSFCLNAGECFPLSSSYTKVAWVNLQDTASNNIISSQDIAGGHVLYVSISQGFRLSSGQNGSWNMVQDPVPLEFDTWYHVAVTFDYSTGLMVLYKNGAIVDQVTVPVEQRDITDATVLVGAFANSSQWEGLIDEARLYSNALSEEQIAALYAGPNIIKSTETTIDETWQCEVTPFSDITAGDSEMSNTLTVGDPEPWVDNVVLAATSPNNLTTDDLVCTYDLYGTAVTAATAWYRDAAPLMTLYLPFEGGEINCLLDLSGSNNHTIPSGAAPVWYEDMGHDGLGAIALNVSAAGQYLDAGECFPTEKSYTKAMWVQRTGSGSNNLLSGDEVTGGHVFYASSSSQADHLAAGHSGHWNIVRDPGDPLELGVWYHAAVTFDYETGEMVLYKDGVEVDRGTALVSEREVTDATAQVGAFMSSSQWHGYMDDARVYDRALSADQIAALFNNDVDRIKADETVINETWYAVVTPFSAAIIGTPVMSNAITINPEELIAPLIIHPHPDSILYEMVPTFQWTVSPSPYVDRTTYYRLCVATESDFLYVSTVDSLISPGYAWPESLDFHEDYCWRVDAWVDLDTGVVTSTSAACDFWTWTVGDIDKDHELTISDLTTFVDFMFGGGDPIEPLFIADIDNQCQVTISDLTYFVDYLFGGGTAPQLPNCP